MTTVEVPFPGRCELGEGPHWDVARGRLRYVDINGGVVHDLDPATGSCTVVMSLPSGS